MPVGNEGAGTVVAAGSEAAAQALVGKRVACFPGGMFAEYALADARRCMVLPEGITAAEGASCFVNPMTALGFVETMRAEGHTALVHTAAASNLGQMLVKICREDGIGLVNVVRSQAQAELLRGLGAEHVLDSTAPDFSERLIDAVAATGATMGFDAVGGGKLAGQLLYAMEQAALRGAGWSRYGSDGEKKVYIYGALDLAPTILTRNFGFTWDLGGWLLLPKLAKLPPERVAAMNGRILAGLKTTFASHYKAHVTLEQMLDPAAVAEYNARRTGEKYLVVP